MAAGKTAVGTTLGKPARPPDRLCVGVPFSLADDPPVCHDRQAGENNGDNGGYTDQHFGLRPTLGQRARLSKQNRRRLGGPSRQRESARRSPAKVMGGE